MGVQAVPPPTYNTIPTHFVPPYTMSYPPTPPVTNLSFTPIVPSSPQPQQPKPMQVQKPMPVPKPPMQLPKPPMQVPKPPMQVPIVQKKPDIFDLPHNCPNSLR